MVILCFIFSISEFSAISIIFMVFILKYYKNYKIISIISKKLVHIAYCLQTFIFIQALMKLFALKI